MKKVFAIMLVFSGLFIVQGNLAAQTASAPDRVVGAVTGVDQAAGKLTIKTDAGATITVVTNEKSSVLRLPAGETSAQNAIKISLADIVVGDRLFARGTSVAGTSIDARQVVVTGSVAATADAQAQQRQREEFRQRGLNGRITALNASKREATIQARSREGAVPVIVAVSDSTKVFRYAPDSMNIKDASRSSFAELKVGDQVRGLGERSADGTRFTAAEIIAGTMARTAGQVVAVNAAKNELTLKNNQGQNITVAVGQRSALRRVTPEVAASFAADRPRPEGSGQGQAGQTGNNRAGSDPAATPGQEGQPRRPRERRDGAPGGARAGRGFQEIIESLPAITVADLRKGDLVFVSGSEGVDASRITAITLITGDATFMSRFMQNGPNRGPQSPGLPGDVVGGGVGPAERPTSP